MSIPGCKYKSNFADATTAPDESDCQLVLYNGGMLVNAGGSLIADPCHPASVARQRWACLLRQLCRRRPHKPINGIILAVSASTFYPADGKTEPAYAILAEKGRLINERLTECQRITSLRLPVYMVITHCDRIPGFDAYFRCFPPGIASEILGWSSPHPIEMSYDDPWTEEAFREVHANLVARKMELLGTSQNWEFPDGLFTFPDELNKLANGVQSFLRHAFLQSISWQACPLRGLYFTGEVSPSGDGSPTREAGAAPEQHPREEIEIPSASAPKEASGQKIFFLSNLMDQKITTEKHLATPVQRIYYDRFTRQHVAYAAGILLTLLALIFIPQGYHRLLDDKKTVIDFLQKGPTVLRPYDDWIQKGASDLNSYEDLIQSGQLMKTHFFVEWRLPSSWIEELCTGFILQKHIARRLAYRIERSVFIPLKSQLLKHTDKEVDSVPRVSIRRFEPGEFPEYARLIQYVDRYRQCLNEIENYNFLVTNDSADIAELTRLVRYVYGEIGQETKLPIGGKELLHYALYYAEDLPIDLSKTSQPDRFLKKYRILFTNMVERLFVKNEAVEFVKGVKTNINEIRADEDLHVRDVRSNEAKARASINNINGLARFSSRNGAMATLSKAFHPTNVFYKNASEIPAFTNALDCLSQTSGRAHIGRNISEVQRLLTRYANENLATFNQECIDLKITNFFILKQDTATFTPDISNFVSQIERLETALQKYEWKYAIKPVSQSHSEEYLLSMSTTPLSAAQNAFGLASEFTQILTNGDSQFSASFSEDTGISPEGIRRIGILLLDSTLKDKIHQLSDAESEYGIEEPWEDRMTQSRFEPVLKREVNELSDTMDCMSHTLVLCQALKLASSTRIAEFMKAYPDKLLARLDLLAADCRLYEPESTTEKNLPNMRAKLNSLAIRFAAPILKTAKAFEELDAQPASNRAARWQFILDTFASLELRSPDNPLLNLEEYIRLNRKTSKTLADYEAINRAFTLFQQARQPGDGEANFFAEKWAHWQDSSRGKGQGMSHSPLQIYSEAVGHFNERLAGKYPFVAPGDRPSEEANIEDIRQLFGLLDGLGDKKTMLAALRGYGLSSEQEQMLVQTVASLKAIKPWFEDALNHRSTPLQFQSVRDDFSFFYNYENQYQPLTNWIPPAWQAARTNASREIFMKVNNPKPFPALVEQDINGSQLKLFDRMYGGTELVYILPVDKALFHFAPLYLAQWLCPESEPDLSSIKMRFRLVGEDFEGIMAASSRKATAPLAFPARLPTIETARSLVTN